MRFVLKNIKRNGWKSVENSEMDTKSKRTKITNNKVWWNWCCSIKNLLCKNPAKLRQVPKIPWRNYEKHEVTFTGKFLVTQNTLIKHNNIVSFYSIFSKWINHDIKKAKSWIFWSLYIVTISNGNNSTSTNLIIQWWYIKFISTGFQFTTTQWDRGASSIWKVTLESRL